MVMRCMMCLMRYECIYGNHNKESRLAGRSTLAKAEIPGLEEYEVDCGCWKRFRPKDGDSTPWKTGALQRIKKYVE